MSALDVGAFLTYLAVARPVSSSTQNQALSAIFLYREVLHLDLPWVGAFSRSKAPKRLPVVLTQAVVKALLTSCRKMTGNWP